MTKLYSELSTVYDEMYQSIFNYEKEFRFYKRLLTRYGCRSVLELGCGSGHMSSPFLEAGFSYAGLDLSADMLRIARRDHPGAQFIWGDMRTFSLGRTFDSVIIAGRSFSHLIKNTNILSTLKSVHAALKKNGVLAFDCFRADKLILNLRKKGSVQDVKRGDTLFRRLSRTSLNLKTGWTFNWEAEYRIKRRGREVKVVKDLTILRAFTEEELKLFLKLCGFEVLDCSRGKVYALVARRRHYPT